MKIENIVFLVMVLILAHYGAYHLGTKTAVWLRARKCRKLKGRK